MKKTTSFFTYLVCLFSFHLLLANSSSQTNSVQSTLPLVVEAETGKTYRGADVQDCDSCSNLKHVGNVGGPSSDSGYLVNTVSVEKAGTYKMNLNFISGDPRVLFISANGQTPIEKTLNSGAWDVGGVVELDILLEAGTNSIKFYNNNNYAPNIDKFSLTLFAEAAPCVTCFGPYEAENGVITAPASIQDCDTCSGGKQVGDMGYSDRFFTQNVNIVTPGTYRIFVNFSSGDTRSLSITANDATTVSGDCFSKDWGVVFMKTFDIVLEAGNNNLKFHTPGNWSPNIDKFRLQLLSGLGLDSKSASSFVLYPNPSKSNWNLIAENETIEKVEVIDSNGKLLFSDNPKTSLYQIDGSNLSKGIYFAKIGSESGTQVVKIIKD